MTPARPLRPVPASRTASRPATSRLEVVADPSGRRRALAGIALAAAACAPGLTALAHATQASPPTAGTVPPAGVTMGGAFTLVDHRGAPLLIGTPGPATLLFFGFTSCPSVCPTSLADAAAAAQRLGRDAPRVVFVTLDPERDTREVLGAYVGAFDERFIGATGTPAQIRAAADAFRVGWRKVPTAGGYTIDHSAWMYLLDERGAVVRLYAFGTPAAVIAGEIAKLRSARLAGR